MDKCDDEFMKFVDKIQADEAERLTPEMKELMQYRYVHSELACIHVHINHIFYIYMYGVHTL